jgi:hypothetical protein
MSQIISFLHFLYLFLPSDIHLIFGTLLCHTKLQIKFEFDFDPLIFHEAMAHGLKKNTRIVSFLHFCSLAVSDSYKSKLSFVMLELFLIEDTASRGLGVACNTLRMIVFMLIETEISVTGHATSTLGMAIRKTSSALLVYCNYLFQKAHKFIKSISFLIYVLWMLCYVMLISMKIYS